MSLMKHLAGLILATFVLSGCNTFANQPDPLSPIHHLTLEGLTGSELDLSKIDVETAIKVDEDQSLNARDLRWLVTNKTVQLARVSDLTSRSPVYFSLQGTVEIEPEQGRVVQGNWHVRGNQICYQLGSHMVCSVLKIAKADDLAFLYFVRTDGLGATEHPTAVIVSRASGRLARRN